MPGTYEAAQSLITNPGIFERPEPMAHAWCQVVQWLDDEAVWVPQPTERHRHLLEALMGRPGVQANFVSDAHLAALAIEYGLLLCSTDRDFARFQDLRWQNPLTS